MPRAVIPLLAAAIVAVGVIRFWPSPTARLLHGVVVRAVDGDTLIVRLGATRFERVRVIGVDTPEDVAPGRPVQCWSRRAARFTSEQTVGRGVTLLVGREARDHYGRLLAYVRVTGGVDLEEALLRGGYARPLAIPPNVDRAVRYATLAMRAERAGRGLWGHCRAP